MWRERYLTGYGLPVIRDPVFEEFLEEEMRRHFGVIGADGCQHFREQIEEAKRNDPYAFEHLIKRLLEKYVKLSTKIRNAKKRAKKSKRQQVSA